VARASGGRACETQWAAALLRLLIITTPVCLVTVSIIVIVQQECVVMSKNPLREAQMADLAHMNQATKWARALTQQESRGPGDIENAWRRLEARYGVPARTFWALRYRPPKDLLASIYLRLLAAYQAECNRQMRKLKNELAIAKAKSGSLSSVVASITAEIATDEQP
jgi:hypothetical protein